MSANDPIVPPAGSAPDIHLVIQKDHAAAQLSALAAGLLERREAILAAWRAAGEAAPGLKIASSLSRAQFNDHIPALLDCLASTLRSWPAEQSTGQEQVENERVSDHGLQRWQQGYPLRELIAEWGHLQICVGDELERYQAAHPGLEPTVMGIARRAWAQMCAGGVTESATQYWRLNQTEAAGHVHDLEKALSSLRVLEQSRAEAWRTAAHDLRGSVSVVTGASSVLSDNTSPLPEQVRVEMAGLLGKSVSSLHEMLNDLLSLARLDAGHEQRELTTFDAAELLRDFCEASQLVATKSGLFLKTEGPSTLPVQGDRTKVLRILQNLLLNAVKYTQRGGVTVTWGLDKGRDTDRWTFSVQDTGPGIGEDAGPMAQDLSNATDIANNAQALSPDRRREIAPAATVPSASAALPAGEQAGEGVGLSIVKRLCELLEAGLELATSPGQGSTFRVLLPRSYAHSSPAAESDTPAHRASTRE